MADDRARMLGTLRASLAKNRAALAREAGHAPHTPPPFVHPEQSDLVAQFAGELARLEAQAHHCPDDEAALEEIRALLQRHDAMSVIAWKLDQIDLQNLDALLAEMSVDVLDTDVRAAEDRSTHLHTLEPAQVCLSGVDSAIAESGTLVLRSGPGRPRLASLLAPVHIAVVRADQIVRGLGEALALVQQRYGPDVFADSSNLMLISGPSRTGDIEQTLVLGAHGPRELHVLIVG